MLNFIAKIFLFLSLIFCFSSYFYQDTLLLFYGCLSVWMHNILFALRAIHRNIIFLLFHVTFFIFLLGRVFVVHLFGHETVWDDGLLGTAFYDKSIVDKTLLAIYVSLIFLYISYAFFMNFRLKDRTPVEQTLILCRRIVSKYFFFFCLIVRFVYDFEMLSVSTSSGYYETFSTFKSSLPSVLVSFSKMYDVAFFAFLATFPKKKEAFIPILLFLIEGALAAATGRRSIFVLSLLVILVYYAVRSISTSSVYKKEEIKQKPWLGRFEKIMIFSFAPVGIMLLNLIEAIRNNSLVDGVLSVKSSLGNFLYSQGVSINVIGYTQLYNSEIPNNKIYSLGPIFEFFDQFRRLFSGLPQLSGQSIERATDGFLFSHAISFLIMPSLYLLGVGYGSSYIAELYNDFSYVGVILGSIFYGAFMVLAFNMIVYGNFLMKTFALLMIRTFFFTPRASFIYFIVNSFSLSKILGYFIIVLLTWCLIMLMSAIRKSRRI